MTATETCASCGATLRDGIPFCVACGIPRPVASSAAESAPVTAAASDDISVSSAADGAADELDGVDETPAAAAEPAPEPVFADEPVVVEEFAADPIADEPVAVEEIIVDPVTDEPVAAAPEPATVAPVAPVTPVAAVAAKRADDAPASQPAQPEHWNTAIGPIVFVIFLLLIALAIYLSTTGHVLI